MNPSLVAFCLGWVLVGLAAVEIVPLAAALVFGEPILPYAASALAAAAFGLPIALSAQPRNRRMRSRDGFLVVSLAWVLVSVFGSLPYALTDVLGPVDALFEAVAGFTTTGSTVLVSIEGAPRALLLWRAMTQWLGGMGIIVFAIALMPLLGVGGMQLFKAEMTGPVADKLTPRISETARRLWMIYLGFTAIVWLLLRLAGMSGFEALCHAFTTISTGGFSTRGASIGGFGSPLIEWIVIAFMLIGGINFVLHYRVLTGHGRAVLRDGELRYFLTLIAGAAAVVAAAIWRDGASAAETIRTALFQVVALCTGTGYASADFNGWPALALLVLLQLMILGGMAGSTTGGVKSLRTLIGLRALADAFARVGHRRALSHGVRYAGRPVPAEVLAGIWAFLGVYFAIAAGVAAVVAGAGYDLITAASAGLTSVGNVGPGLGAIGPAENFAHFPGHVKLVLCAAMVAGRLELFTLLILFHPQFWRR